MRWCRQLSDFVRAHVLERHVLSALVIPVVFGLAFPVYWLVVCPQIWAMQQRRQQQQREGGALLLLLRPRSWLIGYWLLASAVWLVFLGVCFFRTRSGRRSDRKRVLDGCSRKRSDSTEDLCWRDDDRDALSETLLLPSPDYYKVSVSAVQPPSEINDAQEAFAYYHEHAWDSMLSPTCSAWKQSEEAYLKQLLPPLSESPCEWSHPSRKNNALTRPPVPSGRTEMTQEAEDRDDAGCDDSSMSAQQFNSLLASLQKLSENIESDFGDKEAPLARR